MKKLLLKIRNCYEDLQAYSKSGPNTLKKALIIFSILLVVTLLVFLPIVSLVFWAVFSAPWLFITASLSLFVISYGYIIKGMSPNISIRIKSWKIAKSLLIVNFIFWLCTFAICAACLIAGLIHMRMVSSKIKFPFANVFAIDIDSSGQIYCLDLLYSRLQLFDNNGRFLRGWFVAPKIKHRPYGFSVDDNNRPCIYIDKKKYTYNSDGQLLSVTITKPIGYGDNYADYRKSVVKDSSGNIFTSAESFFMPWELTKSGDDIEMVLISEPIGLWFVGPPFPMLAFIILSFLPAFILDWKIKPYEILKKHGAKI